MAQGMPGWFWALVALGVLKVAVGATGYALPDPPASPMSPFPWWVYLISLAVYTGLGITLLTGGRRDRRALLLGGGFLYYALKLKFAPREDSPMATFRYSIWYLMALFSFLLIDHYIPAVWPA